MKCKILVAITVSLLAGLPLSVRLTAQEAICMRAYWSLSNWLGRRGSRTQFNPTRNLSGRAKQHHKACSKASEDRDFVSSHPGFGLLTPLRQGLTGSPSLTA